ncbi:MAG: helix-turn-helix transcriptional regulator [Pseudomonadota bacterium]
MSYQITGPQCAAARKLLKLEQSEVAASIGVGRESLSNFEREVSRLNGPNMEKLLAFFDDRSVSFVVQGRARGVLLIDG